MKPLHALPLVLGLLLVADRPRSKPLAPNRPESARCDAVPTASPQTIGHLVSLTREAHAANRSTGFRAGPSAGDFRIELDRLRRGGVNVRQVERYVSDLEASLRRGPRDAGARRHILNNLNYELEVLNRR